MERKKLLNYLPLIIAIFVFCLLNGKTAFAANEFMSIKMEAEISTGKYIKQNQAIPVTVAISNQGEDFEGKLQILVKRGYRDEDYSAYYQDIKVPRNGNKMFYLYAARTQYYGPQLMARLRHKNEYRDVALTYTLTQPNDLHVIVLNKSRGGFAYLTGYKKILPQNSSFYVSYPEPIKLTPMWKCYDNADIVMINDLPSLNFDATRQKATEKALIDWVISGGTVLLSSNLDPNEYNGSLFKDYLPIEPTRTVAVRARDSGKFNKDTIVLMDGKLKENSEIINSFDNHPLLIRRRLGDGNIFYLTADLSSKPFKDDFEEGEIWGKILEQRNRSRVEYSYIDNSNILNNQPETASPPVGAIFWSLFAYIILIGPVNYYYLKRKDKLMYLFLTVPAIAIVFSIGIFLAGYSIKGSSIVLRKFNIIYIGKGQSAGKVDSIISLFSPGKANYELTLMDPSAIGWELGNQYDLPKAKVKLDDSFTFKDLQIQMWCMRQFGAQKIQYFAGPLEMNVRDEQGFFQGFIDNQTGKTISGCILYQRGSISNPFDLPPGKLMVNVPIAKKTLTFPRAIAEQLQQSYGLNTEEAKKNIPLAEAKITALEQIAESMMRSGNNVVLVGWSNDDVMEIGLNKKNPKVFSANLVFVR